MAPTTSILIPRQFGNNNNDGPFGDRNSSGISKWAIVGIIVAVLLVSSITGLLLFFRFRQRRRAIKSAIHLHPTQPYKPPPSAPSNSNNPSKYGAGSAGYGSTPDQNHALLGNAEAPAIVMWDPSHAEAAGSTQDGFGYDNNLHLASGIQRPASVATFSAPPPRYEEATTHSAPSSAALRPQGEAASYFNAAVPMGEERGRSRSREPAAEGASRGRALSVDNRSINGDRRRSISRFREEGMVDVKVDNKG